MVEPKLTLDAPRDMLKVLVVVEVTEALTFPTAPDCRVPLPASSEPV
jgi:hypothetical protein